MRYREWIQQQNLTFGAIWFGQLVSIIGSSMTSFALGIWVYQRANSTTAIALIWLVSTLPYMVVAPFSGPLIDRWDRRKILLLCEWGAGLSTLALCLLLISHQLTNELIYIISASLSVFNALQLVTYTATIPILVSNNNLARANGMIDLARASGAVVAPLFAGAMFASNGLESVILIDLLTFIVSIFILSNIRITHRESKATSEKSSYVEDFRAGWSYLYRNSGLFSLLLFYAAINFLLGIVIVLRTPLLLSFTSPTELARVSAAGGIGAIVGSTIMSIWGGPKQRIYGVFWFMALVGVFVLVSGLYPSSILIAASTFGLHLVIPIQSACGTAISLSKVPIAMIGRYIAVATTIQTSATAIAFLSAGPLADHLFEPLMRGDNLLVVSVGGMIGVGNGRGIGLFTILIGIAILVVNLIGFISPRLRFIEKELPDNPSTNTF